MGGMNHILNAIDVIKRTEGTDCADLIPMLARLSLAHTHKNDRRYAKDLITEALALAEQLGDKVNVECLALAKSVGLTAISKDYAGTDGEDAVELLESKYGPEDERLACVLMRFGASLQHRGENQRAVNILNRALPLVDKAFRSPHGACALHVEVARTFKFLGLAQKRLGEH